MMGAPVAKVKNLELSINPYALGAVAIGVMLLAKHARQQSKLRKSCENQLEELQKEAQD